MKAPSPRVAMLLSIGGVLAAGSAAALVNSQVLDSQSGGVPASATAVSTSASPASSATAPTTATPSTTQVATTLSTVAAPPVTVASTQLTAASTSNSVASSVAPTTAPATTPLAGTQATYRLGSAGTAVLDTSGGRLTVVSVTPVVGWTVDRAESDGASVEIRLKSEAGEVRFDASLVGGVVRVSLDSDDDSSGSGGDDSSGSGSGNSGRGGGDDDNSGSGSDDD